VLDSLYASPNFMRVIKSRRMKWAGHAACAGDMRNAYKILVGNLKGRDHLEYLGVDGKIILEQILAKR